MTPLTLEEVDQHYHRLVVEGQYAEALDLATEYFGQFSHHAQQVVTYWRMDMASRLGRAGLVLRLLQDAVQAGHWYGQMETDPAFQLVKDAPEFKSLAERCERLRAEAIASARPVMKVMSPPTSALAGAARQPLLFALHGNGLNVETCAPHWRAALDHGWLVALPQAPETFGPDNFVWNDWDWSIPAVQAQYAVLCAEHPVDGGQVVLAGFSMGAGLALWLALTQGIPARGVVAVSPFLEDTEVLKPWLERPEIQGLRVYLVASPRDEYCYEVALKLAELLPKYGLACKLDLYPREGHNFPPAFEARLPEALAFVSDGSPA